jgi:GH24 family phage-related lysozyme (muramidase)
MQEDTVWKTYTKDVLVGIDTTYEPKTEKRLVKTERKEVLVYTKNQWVHSLNNAYGNKAAVSFTLPSPQTSNNQTSSVVAWAYWVGATEAADQAWQQNVDTVNTLATTLPYTSPLGALATGAVSQLAVPTAGEDVYYAITDDANKILFLKGKRFRLLRQGKGVAGYGLFTAPALRQGSYTICLSNDNALIPVNVNIKVVAIVETNYYEDRTDAAQK